MASNAAPGPRRLPPLRHSVQPQCPTIAKPAPAAKNRPGLAAMMKRWY